MTKFYFLIDHTKLHYTMYSLYMRKYIVQFAKSFRRRVTLEQLKKYNSIEDLAPNDKSFTLIFYALTWLAQNDIDSAIEFASARLFAKIVFGDDIYAALKIRIAQIPQCEKIIMRHLRIIDNFVRNHFDEFNFPPKVIADQFDCINHLQFAWLCKYELRHNYQKFIKEKKSPRDIIHKMISFGRNLTKRFTSEFFVWFEQTFPDASAVALMKQYFSDQSVCTIPTFAFGTKRSLITQIMPIAHIKITKYKRVMLRCTFDDTKYYFYRLTKAISLARELGPDDTTDSDYLFYNCGLRSPTCCLIYKEDSQLFIQQVYEKIAMYRAFASMSTQVLPQSSLQKLCGEYLAPKSWRHVTPADIIQNLNCNCKELRLRKYAEKLARR
jgi:hypothetical protein